MATKYPRKREVARLVTENKQPCVFCDQDVDDEVIYGKLYALGDIQCHYFCVLLSCCLVQKGRDSEGLFGFLYKDIMAEVERSKKHRCSYCGRGGASLGCSVAACRKQFHLPCGRRKNAVSLFYGNYKSFCELHAPKQKISDSVMAKAKERMKRDRLIKAGKIPIGSSEGTKQTENSEDPALLCVICYEDIQAYPTTQTFWPPCCGRDAWLHRTCLQRMALSAGMHYLKCPLCNDKENFYDAVCDQGYYLPDRDAAWELEQNAFAEIYNREVECAAADCKCPFGRTHDELGMWDIKLCLLCGSWGQHSACSGGGGARAVCAVCRPAAAGIEDLETRLTAVMAAEQALERRLRSGPLMPARMSLRRTKARLQTHSASSSSQNLPTHDTQVNAESPVLNREDLSLKPPKARPKLLTPTLRELETKLLTPTLRELETKLLSPIKMLEQRCLERGRDVVVTTEVIEKIRLKFSKPRPLSAKKKIVNEILDDLFKNVFKENAKSKEPVKEWNSPRKSCDVNDIEGVKENLEPILTKNIDGEAAETHINPEQDAEHKNKNIEEKSDEIGEENHQHTAKNLEEESNVDDKSSDKENNPNDLNDDFNVHDKDDESSRSTFQLPPEFVAESEDSLPILDTPKKLKMVDMKQSSIEISEANEVLNIDVVQMGSGEVKEFIKNLTLKSPTKNMMSFKFSPLDTEPLTENVDMDVESFKDKYLNEVGRDKSFLTNVTNKTVRKRKLDMTDGVELKKRKHMRKRKLKIKIKSKDKMERVKKIKKMIRVKDKHVGIKIRLKKGKTKKIKLNNKLKSKKKQKVKSFKQYVLKYSPLQTNKVIAKPEEDVAPMKRKYTKQEKSPDNLVQTTIQSFFKAKCHSQGTEHCD